MTRRVLLVGMMATGKSSVGKAVSQRTGWPYVDNDELVERITGLPTKRLHEERGEAAMRAAESEALTEVLTAPPPLVAGVAAGTVTIDGDRERLKSGDAVVVWLRARVDTLVTRVGSGEGRAFLQPDPEAALRRLAQGRDPLYAEVADLTLDVDDATVDELADRVISAVGEA